MSESLHEIEKRLYALKAELRRRQRLREAKDQLYETKKALIVEKAVDKVPRPLKEVAIGAGRLAKSIFNNRKRRRNAFA